MTLELQHITTLTIYPTGTRYRPVLFETLDDALSFSRISGRVIWAIVRGFPMWSYRVFPGGRNERFSTNKDENRLAPSGTRLKSGFGSR